MRTRRPTSVLITECLQWVPHGTWGHDGLREARPGHGGDGVAKDVVLAALDSQSVRQPQQAQLGRTVVRLAEVAVDSRRRGRHDDPAHERDGRQNAAVAASNPGSEIMSGSPGTKIQACARMMEEKDLRCRELQFVCFTPLNGNACVLQLYFVE